MVVYTINNLNALFNKNSISQPLVQFQEER